MLQSYYHPDLVEAGCDEAGRGCLAGSVYAAAVILPHDYTNPLITDSKQLTDRQRHQLRPVIERDAIAWGLGIVTAAEIDRINILRASILAMHRALDALKVRPEALIIDGNRFQRYQSLPYQTIVKGDAKYLSIAAASILAKVTRDSLMEEYDAMFPGYGFAAHKGYGTAEHKAALLKLGPCEIHRRQFVETFLSR